jgi:Glycerate kinase family
LLEGCPIVHTRTSHVLLPRRLLVTGEAFAPALAADQVLAAIASGLKAGGLPAPDLCPIIPDDAPGGIARLLDELDFDARMHGARAVVIAAARLQERALAGSVTFALATRARQGGVPAYAVAGENALHPFDARMLDLQVILEARTARALAAAGRKLAGLV